MLRVCYLHFAHHSSATECPVAPDWHRYLVLWCSQAPVRISWATQLDPVLHVGRSLLGP